MSGLLSTVIALFATMGPLGLASCALIEKLIPIVPSSGLLIMLGRFAVADAAALPGAVVATTVGSTLGSLAWYGLGRWVGAERGARLLTFGSLRSLGHERRERLHRAYLRRRFWITFLSQTMPVVRVYIAVPAGALAVPLTGFVVATFAGAVVWNTVFLATGVILRNNPVAGGHGDIVTTIVVALLAAEAIIAGGIRLLRRRREPV
ncbi:MULTISPECIES: DedA family protein [unclassified Sphingomonas]|mgnify:FL=1|uniref:DedA family protein n=1 Tax=unclassified Sphingomonas TaxID=196159 RepID=UPI00092B9597|nr:MULTISPECIES: DedA family protein [unclassified Sphingomonas]OJU17857.1 MAG: hypothetical protein BGN95_16430 [Sphingomonas sp. 66-10]